MHLQKSLNCFHFFYNLLLSNVIKLPRSRNVYNGSTSLWCSSKCVQSCSALASCSCVTSQPGSVIHHSASEQYTRSALGSDAALCLIRRLLITYSHENQVGLLECSISNPCTLTRPALLAVKALGLSTTTVPSLVSKRPSREWSISTQPSAAKERQSMVRTQPSLALCYRCPYCTLCTLLKVKINTAYF